MINELAQAYSTPVAPAITSLFDTTAQKRLSAVFFFAALGKAAAG
jgi:hypothetical protein